MAEETKSLSDDQIRRLFKRQTERIVELGLNIQVLENLLIQKGYATESEIRKAIETTKSQAKAAAQTIAQRSRGGLD